MRLTKQRKIILERLKQSRSHPTAVQIYDEVRSELPNISLGTVYRNLDILSKEGMISKIENCGDQKRFDGIPDPHLHIICSRCGKVQDAPQEPDLDLDQLTRVETDFLITGVRLELLGVCPDCNRENN